MNILIVTLFKENYGAFLQAYALGKYIQSKGHEVFYKNYYYPTDANIYRNISIQIEKGFRLYTTSQKLDLIICGSDVIWAIANKSCANREDFRGGGDLDQTVPIISYASSAAGSGYKETIRWAWRLNRFRAISVRDERTRKIIQPFVLKKVRKVVDPTFLIDWTKIVLKPKLENHVFVYSYGLNNKDINRIINFSKKENKRIVCCGGIKIDGAIIFDGDPFSWLGMIKYADMVFTSTFHGTVFSVIFKKKVCILGYSMKIRCLLNDIEIEDVNDYLNISDMGLYKLDDMIKESKDFLDRFI